MKTLMLIAIVTMLLTLFLPSPNFCQSRTMVQCPMIFYVSTTGSDSNNGLTRATAFRTPQYAVDQITKLDFNNQTVTLQFADGDYYTMDTPLTMTGMVGGGKFILKGNPHDWSAVKLYGIRESAVLVTGPMNTEVQLQYLQVQSEFGDGIHVCFNVFVGIAGVVFGECKWSHIGVYYNSHFRVYDGYSIIGGAQQHYAVWIDSSIMFEKCPHSCGTGKGITINLFNTPLFETSFATVTAGYIRIRQVEFKGIARGRRYIVNNNGVINTDGTGANYFPGDVSGYCDTGGQYI